jgi:hypothetical protein
MDGKGFMFSVTNRLFPPLILIIISYQASKCFYKVCKPSTTLLELGERRCSSERTSATQKLPLNPRLYFFEALINGGEPCGDIKASYLHITPLLLFYFNFHLFLSLPLFVTKLLYQSRSLRYVWRAFAVEVAELKTC